MRNVDCAYTQKGLHGNTSWVMSRLPPLPLTLNPCHLAAYTTAIFPPSLVQSLLHRYDFFPLHERLIAWQ